MPNDEELLQAIKSQRVGTQRQVRKKAFQVASATSQEEEDIDEEEEESKVWPEVQKTITVGEKQIPVGSTPRPQPIKKIRFKLTTKRPREE